LEVTREIAARAIGISARRFHELVQGKILPAPLRHGRHDLVAVVHAWIKYTLADKEADCSTVEAKRRFWNARALREELQAEEAADRLIPLIDVMDAWQACFAAVANQVAAVPGRVAAEFSGITDAALIRARLLEEIRVAQSHAANIIQEWEKRLAAQLAAERTAEAIAAANSETHGA
jgi:hypothetical protein